MRGRSRRTVLLIFIAVAVVAAGYLVWHGTTRTSAVNSVSVTPSHAASGRTHHRTKRFSAASATTTTIQAGLISDRRIYAAAILPTLGRTGRVFDSAERTMRAERGNYSALESACSFWSSRIQVMQGEYEGTPHPYTWWTPVGTLHHKLSGIYHFALGATQNCLEAVVTADSDLADQAVSEMATGDQNLHAMEQYVRYLAHRRA